MLYEVITGPVIGYFDPALTMLTRSVITTLDSTFIGMAPVTLKKQFHIFPSAHAADGTGVSSQRSTSLCV